MSAARRRGVGIGDRILAGGIPNVVVSVSGTRVRLADDAGTVQTVEGDLRVHVPLVGASAERAMVGGLRRHLADEAVRLADWARRAT